jgi:hypothetical protein
LLRSVLRRATRRQMQIYLCKFATVLVAIWVVAVPLSGGCASAKPALGEGTECTGATPTECDATLTCTLLTGPRKCRRKCETGCAAGETCGVGFDGVRACFETCTNSIAKGFVCENGAARSCAAPTPADCAVCGCAAGLRCETGVGCAPAFPLKATCVVNADCQSGNCSQVTKTCNPEIGASCTSSDCDRCIKGTLAPTPASMCLADCFNLGSSVCPDASTCLSGLCYKRCDTGLTLGSCPVGFKCATLPVGGSTQQICVERAAL